MVLCDRTDCFARTGGRHHEFGGITPAISPEFLQTLGTGALTLAAIFWVLFVQGGLWRQAIALQLSGEAERVADVYGGTVLFTRFGVTVRTEEFTVCWTGSVRGAQTIVRGAQRAHALGVLKGPLLKALIANASVS